MYQDTAYNPLAVDEVAAQHVSASCIIHYGRASLTPIDQCPAFFVFPKEPIGASEQVAAEVTASLSSSEALSMKKAILVIVDQAYQHAQDSLITALRSAVMVRCCSLMT